MKTIAAQRVVPLRPAKGGRDKKNLRPIDIRRHKALKAYWELAGSLGVVLNLTSIGQKKGLRNGAMASHILAGRERINLEWMMYFAQAFGVPPQVIWHDDWPFPEFTASHTNPVFECLLRRFGTLNPTAQADIIGILKASEEP